MAWSMPTAKTATSMPLGKAASSCNASSSNSQSAPPIRRPRWIPKGGSTRRTTAGCSSALRVPLRCTVGLFADDEQPAVVLRVDPPFGIHRGRRIGGADGELLEDALQEDAALPNGIEVAVFAVGIDHAISVHDSGVHAPLEAVGMVRLATQRAVRVPGAALRVGVLETPLDVQIGIELGHKERLRAQRLGGASLWAPVRIVTIASKSRSGVVIVLENYRVRAVVGKDGRCVVPAEGEGVEKISVGAEMEHVSLGEVIARVGAKEDAAIGRDGGRGGRIIQHAGRRRVARAANTAESGAGPRS